MSFRRKLPKTVKYIEEEFDAVVLDGEQCSLNNIKKRSISLCTACSRGKPMLIWQYSI